MSRSRRPGRPCGTRRIPMALRHSPLIRDHIAATSQRSKLPTTTWWGPTVSWLRSKLSHCAALAATRSATTLGNLGRRLGLRQIAEHAAGCNISVSRLSRKCHRAPNSVFRLQPRPEPQLLGDWVMLAFRIFLFSATAGVVLLTNVRANADKPVAITYVPNSLAEASIANGP